MRLTCEAARRAQTGRVHEAGAGGREAEILLAKVQLAHIVIALTAVLLGCDVAGSCGMVGLQRELGGDLLEGVLRIRKAELVAEEGRFGGSPVGGRGRCNVIECRFDILLRLLD